MFGTVSNGSFNLFYRGADKIIVTIKSASIITAIGATIAIYFQHKLFECSNFK